MASEVSRSAEWQQLLANESKGGRDRVGSQTRDMAGIKVALISVLLPWSIFLYGLSMMAFSPHYNSPTMVPMSVAFVGLIVLICVAMAARSYKTMGYRISWFWFLGVMVLAATLGGYVCGDVCFWKHMLPYYDVSALNAYKHVDISKPEIRGQTLMDAGRIEPFNVGTYVDTSKKSAFTSFKTYCVAPISVKNKTLTHYDFWAVGTDCCDKDITWTCPETQIATARGALRVMNDDMLPYYHLAVEQAAAIHNITIENPLFFTWLENPRRELRARQEDGLSFFLVCFFSSFVMAVAAPAIYSWLFSRVWWMQ